MKPGSDVAKPLGYGLRPGALLHTGRSPLEAANMGIRLFPPRQYAVRCNLVTLGEGGSFAVRTMEDYCAGDISSEEAAELIRFLAPATAGRDAALPRGQLPALCLTWENPEENIGEPDPAPRYPRAENRGANLPDGKATGRCGR